MTYAIVTAAGKGTRFGANKALHRLRERPLIAWALSNFQNNASINEIIVTVPPDGPLELFESVCLSENFTKVRFVWGGETRYDSVRNAFATINDSDAIVLIHDAARPLVSMNLINRILHAVKEYGAVIPALPVIETVKQVEKDRIVRTVPREGLFVAQTPQGFRGELLASAYSKIVDRNVTDEAMLVELAGYVVHIVSGERKNMKITEPSDIQIAECFL
jgi:2-C-methyl-D-erythritol 4-phosphate cytidylyltransferase